jgi:hypothetical protein
MIVSKKLEIWATLLWILLLYPMLEEVLEGQIYLFSISNVTFLQPQSTCNIKFFCLKDHDSVVTRLQLLLQLRFKTLVILTLQFGVDIALKQIYMVSWFSNRLWVHFACLCFISFYGMYLLYKVKFSAMFTSPHITCCSRNTSWKHIIYLLPTKETCWNSHVAQWICYPFRLIL